jgi:F-type H+-transporting ATPase subunit b
MEALGIEPTLLLAQIVNFFIIAVVLKVLLYTPILSMLEKRKKEIAEGLAYAEKMRQQEEAVEGKKAALLAAARKEGQQIVDEARKTAKVEEKQIVEEAHIAADELLKKGKATIEQEREAMQKDIRNETVDLAVLMAKQLLADNLTPELQHKILAKNIKAIEKV